MKYRLFYIIIFSIFITNGYSQCGRPNTSFRAGEKMQFVAYYNLGFIWINAGSAFFDVSEEEYNGQRVYKLLTGGGSHPSYDWIMKVRDTLCSYIDENTLLPYFHSRKSLEGSYVANNYTEFDYQNQIVKAHTSNSERGEHDTILPLQACLYDIVSSVYLVRNMDFSSVKAEQKIPFKAIVDGEFAELYIRYKSTEVINLRDTDRYFRCLKFSVKLVEGSVFNAGEGMTIWITDDKNHLPILVEAGILVGSVKAYLSNYQGLRNPIEAEVFNQK